MAAVLRVLAATDDGVSVGGAGVASVPTAAAAVVLVLTCPVEVVDDGWADEVALGTLDVVLGF